MKKSINFIPKDLTTLFTLISKITPIFVHQNLK